MKNGVRLILCASAGLLLITTHASVTLESPAVSLDDFKWKRFAPSSEVYIDTTLSFTPTREGEKSVDEKKDKLGLWLQIDGDGAHEQTNLCVYASYADLAVDDTKKTRGICIAARRAKAVTSPRLFKLRGTSSIRLDRTYRLTIRTIKDVTHRALNTGDPQKGILGFQIFLDGLPLSSDTPSFSPAYLAYASSSDGWLDRTRDADFIAFLRSAAVFVSLRGETNDETIQSVGYRGLSSSKDVDISQKAPTFKRLTHLDFWWGSHAP